MSMFRALPLPSTLLHGSRLEDSQNDFQNSFQNSPLLGLDILDSIKEQRSGSFNKSDEPKKQLFDNNNIKLYNDQKRRHTLKNSSTRQTEREQSADKENRQLQQQAKRKSMIKQLESELNDLRKSVTR
jgi:hypothetical protein